MLVSGQSSRAAGGQSDRPGPRAALPRGGQDRSKPNQAQGNHCRVLREPTKDDKFPDDYQNGGVGHVLPYRVVGRTDPNQTKLKEIIAAYYSTRAYSRIERRQIRP